MREGRRLGCVDRDRFDSPFGDAGQDALQAVEIHRLVEAVVDGLADQRMVGNADLARQVLRTRCLIGKDGGHEVVGAHAHDGRRKLLSAAVARNGEGARGIPAPARREHRGRKERLRQHFLDRSDAEELEDDLERKRVLFTE